MNNLLEARNLSKFFKEGNEEIKAVNKGMDTIDASLDKAGTKGLNKLIRL